MDKDVFELTQIIADQKRQIDTLTNKNERMMDLILLLSKRMDAVDNKVELNHEAIEFLSSNFVDLCKAIGEAELTVEE